MNGMDKLKLSARSTALVMLLMLLGACERNDYDLLDPESAGKWTLYTTADGLPSNVVSDIKLDNEGNLWFTFPGYGTARYDYNNWTYYRASTTPILNDGINCVTTTSDGRVLFGTENGLSILSAGNIWSSYVDVSADMNINTIKVASNGWIWIGTTDQGFYVNTGNGYIKNLSPEFKRVNVIEEGLQGNIFIGTDNGIIKWDGNNYTYLTTTSGLPDNRVSALSLDRNERLWIGTHSGKTAAWIDRRGLHQLNLMTGTDSVYIRDIFQDRSGSVWFATYSNGLIKYDGVIPVSFKEYNGLPENRVKCIAEDKFGNLWIGLGTKGVVKYTLPIE